MKIGNEFLQAEISTCGGFLTSLKLFGKELLNPRGEHRISFPVIGQPGPLVIDETSISLPRNGFLPGEDLDIESSDEDKLVLLAPKGSKRLAQFPFDYDLKISYEFEEDILVFKAEITNPTEKTMPFQMGIHNELLVNMEKSTIDFKQPETGFIPADGDFVSPIFQFSRDTTESVIAKDLIEEGQTLVIAAPNHSISLHTGTGVRVEFRYSSNTIALSRQEGSIAIDPWWGLAPRGAEEDNPLDRETFLKLPPKSTRTLEARLRFSLD